MFHRAPTSLRIFATLTLVAVLACALAGGADAKKRKSKRSDVAAACNPASTSAAAPAFSPLDAWRSGDAYSFPFNGYTPKGKGRVLWKKVSSAMRRADYPAPNLPSCRIGSRGSEDRTSRKAGQYLETPLPIDGSRSYTIVDTFDRPVTTIHWEEESLIARHPERWGWYVDAKWAGHDALRAWEVQGNACKLRFDQFQNAWVRDANFVMVAFNPALGSQNRKDRPNKTAALRVRGFIDRRALPGWANYRANRYDFGCGSTTLTPQWGEQSLGQAYFESGYGAGRHYVVGQYYGETAAQLNLLPGEVKVHNNMPYDSYNPKPQFGGAMYAMINTTGIAGGGMVRGIVRAGVDTFTLYDQMNYCDPNYTLGRVLLRRNGKRVSKAKYFEPATFSPDNEPTVRWVFGELRPDPASVRPEAANASDNPLSARLFAWIPIHCDR
ncbi:MAG: hypothetical protein ACRDKI_04495 [Solirubrobacterales bacterium]